LNSAFDPLSSMSKSEREGPERQQRQTVRRLMAFRIAIVLAFGVLSVKLWDMQIVHTDNYLSKAVDNRVRERTVKALRGVIYDRNHQQLVFNRPSFDAAVYVEDLPKNDQPAVVDKLAKLLQAEAQPIDEKITVQRKAAPTIPVIVASSIPWETVLALKEDHTDLPGVIPVPRTVRDYVHGPLLSGVEGYVGPITQEEYPTLKDEGYEQDDKIGRAGVELTYQDDLRGSNGLQHVEVDAGGREVQVIDEVPAKPGNSLELTIDSALQQDVTRYLRWGLDRAHCYEANEDEKVYTANCSADVKAAMAKPAIDGGHGDEGAAIVMDVHTGEILAMAAFPQYDNNVFSGRAIDQAKAADVLTRHDNPLINRALSALAPGSTFKQITSAGALQDHVVSPTTGISVGASWGGGIDFRNWEARSYANMNVVDAIAQSNDIWMATVVAGSGSVKGMGIDRLTWWAQQFGLTKQLGIDLPFEQKGLMPTTAWKAANFDAPDEKIWYTADSLFAAIGQGFDTATPLQILDVTVAVANGGDVMVPHVVKAVVDSQGKTIRGIAPEVLNHVPIEPHYLETVRQGMRKGVYTGSSYKTNLRDLKIAGKTGTAEFVANGPNGKPIRDKRGFLPTNAWWVGFAPYDNPQVAVVVLIHDAGEGADFAAPVGRKMLARYFHVSDVRRTYGCDTPQTTPGACAANFSTGWANKDRMYYDDQHEEPSDAHDPEFPLPAEMVAAPSAKVSPSAGARNAR
jgi:penicillin-binding protein 2